MKKNLHNAGMSGGNKKAGFFGFLPALRGNPNQKQWICLLLFLLPLISVAGQGAGTPGTQLMISSNRNFTIDQEQETAVSDFSVIKWGTAASQRYSVSEAQGEVVKGKLYSFGGFDSQKSTYTPTSRAYVYDPAANTWTALAAMPAMNGTRYGGVTHAGFTNDGADIYFAGGYTANAKGTGQIFGTKEVWKFFVTENRYVRLPDLPITVAAGQLEYLNDKLYHIGGTNAARTKDLGDHYVLDLHNMSAGWKMLAPLPNPRQHAGSAVFEGKIYYIGGQSGHDNNLITKKDVHRYDPATDKWEKMADLPVPDGANGRGHISSSVVVMGNRILVLGGETTHITGKTNMVSAYTPATNHWENLTPLPAKRYSGVAGLLGGNVFYTGGASAITYKGVPVVSGSSQQVSSLTLINADNNQDLQTLTSGATLNLATLPTKNLNIRANTNPATVGSVVFSLTGAQSKSIAESASPYALFGDNTKGDYYAWTPAVGSYTLKATPYTASKGSGTAGTALSVSFTVENQAPENSEPLITNIAANTGKRYTLADLAVGKLMYTDRSYKITAVPSVLAGASLIQSANDDKWSTSSSLLSFDLSQQATVYVAYDPRGTSQPAWLSGWQKSADKLGVNDSKISSMNLYSKTFAAGKITLGGNLASPAAGAETNYLVIAVPASQAFAAARAVAALSAPEQHGFNLRVFPNPNAGDKIYVEVERFAANERVAITLCDILGHTLLSRDIVTDEQGKAGVEIPVTNNMKRGIYLVKAHASSGQSQSKLIVH